MYTSGRFLDLVHVRKKASRKDFQAFCSLAESSCIDEFLLVAG